MQQEAKSLRLTHKGDGSEGHHTGKEIPHRHTGSQWRQRQWQKNKQRKVSGEKTRMRSSIVMMMVWTIKVRMLLQICVCVGGGRGRRTLSTTSRGQLDQSSKQSDRNLGTYLDYMLLLYSWEYQLLGHDHDSTSASLKMDCTFRAGCWTFVVP